MESGRKAVFRFDARPEIGGGHAIRCLTLADSMTTAGWQCWFAVHQDTQAFMHRVGRDDLALILLSDDLGKEPNQIASHFDGDNYDLLIVDHYERDIAFETACRRHAKRIMVIDDLADRKHDADILLDQNYGRTPSDYKDLIRNNCQFLIGPNYALLRPQFLTKRVDCLINRQQRTRVQKVLISFGMSDIQELVLTALVALQDIGFSGQIIVVMPAGTPSFTRAQTNALDIGERVQILCDVEDMATLMADADLAIGAGGTMSLERCVMGLPAIVATITKNQVFGTAALSQLGAVWEIRASSADLISFQAKLREILGNFNKIKQASRLAANVCDGAGPARVLGAIND